MIQWVILACALIAGGTFYRAPQVVTVVPSTQQTDLTKTTSFSQHNKLVILWDIHNVIVQRDVRTLLCALWNFPRKKEMLRESSIAMSKDMARGLYLLLTAGVTGEVFSNIALKHNNGALADFITAWANAQCIIPGTASIIYDLHERGYTQHIGSNIGIDMFNRLKDKPEMQELFNERIFDLRASQFAHYDFEFPDKSIAKPKAAFYETYLSKNKLGPKEILFIDDNKKNIEAAQNCGLHTLLFTDPKKLKSDLYKILGISSQHTQELSGTEECGSNC